MSNTRIKKLQSILHKKQAAACFITNQKNIFYLTGFIGISPYEHESTLLITTNQAYLYIPQMYRDRAMAVVHTDITLVTDLPKGLFGSWTMHATTGTIVCESENLTLAEFDTLQGHTTATLLPEKGIVAALRLYKDDTEIAALKKASAMTDKAFTHIQEFIAKRMYTRLCEHDVIEELRRYSHALGSHGFGFDPIVAYGPGSAEPHYISNNTPIKPGNVLLIDMGFVVDGYTSDFSRTLSLGAPTDEFTRIYALVQETQQACLDACKPGASTTTLYTLSQDIFTKHGVADLYLHSLGHGVGLDVHEAPRLASSHDTILKPGMVITIEPGLYLSNQFGVRIEDLVLITEDGYELLTTSSKKMISLV